MKKLVGISTLLLLAAAIHFGYGWGVEHIYTQSANPAEIGGGSIYVKNIVQNIDINVENFEFSSHFNPLSSPSKNLKKSLTPLAFTEQYTTGLFKQYIFSVKNLLIRCGRKAIIFPFHYFW